MRPRPTPLCYRLTPLSQRDKPPYHRYLPDIVITDMLMPEKEGIETIRELREKTPYLPIIAISGSANIDLYLKITIELGANAYLKKPFNPAQLLQMVRDLPSGACRPVSFRDTSRMLMDCMVS